MIPVGAKAAGLDIGGLTLSDAADRLAGAFSFPLGQAIEVRVAGHRKMLRPADIGFYFDPYKTARRANIAAKAAPVEIDGDHDVDVPLHVTYDGAALAAFDGQGRPRVADRAAQRAPADQAAPHGPAPRADGLVDRRARAGRRARPAARRPVRHPRRARARASACRRRSTPIDLRKRYRVIVTVDRAHFKLRYFRNLKRRKTYGVAVGMPDYPTPTGRYTIVNKAKDPVWTAPDEPWAGAYRNERVDGGSAENPLKARWMGIVGGVGIHGTAAEDSIGSRASARVHPHARGRRRRPLPAGFRSAARS